MKKYAEKTDACKCGHRFFCAEKTACRLLTNQLGFVFPTVGANCVRPPDCHSEPTGEESRFAQVYFVLLEILRFAQDDKLGFVGVFNRMKFSG